MIIELPEEFNYWNRARIVDGILRIPSVKYVRKFMYEVTIKMKGNTCWYCGRRMKKKEITMDHLYPQYLGGPTIPNNLVPACFECNNDKGILTEEQYRKLISVPKNKREEMKNKLVAENEKLKMNKGYDLPREWISSKKIDKKILIACFMDESYIGKKYSKIEEFYRNNGKLPYPIVVDRNNYLLDGFLVLMFAKNNNISRIPTIVLENVEIVVNK